MDLTFVQDENSVLVNYVLHSIHLIGGPNERSLPNLLPSKIDPFTKEKLLFEPILSQNKFQLDHESINNYEALEREIFKSIEEEKEIDFSQFFSIFKKVSNITNDNLSYPDLRTNVATLSKVKKLGFRCWNLGIKKTVDYAHRILHGMSPALLEDSFQKVLEFFIINGLIEGPKETFDGFDWFLATLFIACDGHIERTCQIGFKISRFQVSDFLWPMLQRNQNNRSIVMFCHEVEEVVAKDIPLVASSFTLSGCTVSQVYSQKEF